MLKKTLIFMLSLFIIAESIMPVYAGESISDLQKKQKAIENKIKEYKAQTEALKAEKNNTQAEINILDNKLNSLNLEVESKELYKQELLLKIKEEEQSIKDLNVEINKSNKILEERLRAMYKQGTGGYLEVVIHSDNLMDAMTRVDMIQKIVKSDTDLLRSIEAQKQQVEGIRVGLETQRIELDEIITNLQIKQREIDEASKEKETYMVNLEKDLKTIKKYEAAMLAQSEQIEKDIKALMSKNTVYVGGEMLWPCPSSYRITSYFGPREEPVPGAGTNHGAIDIGAKSGSAIVAANKGVVLFAGWHYSYGNYVIVDHGGGIATLYGHSSRLLVSAGQTVARGETIALVGSTGYSTGPHLHFEVRENGVRVNPLPYLK